MGPGVQAVAENRLTHLFGAWRAHAAGRLMKIDACRFKRQPAIVEDAPHLPFQIVDHVFMLHPQHPPGQDLVPMAHQVQIGAIVTANILKAVGELLALGEKLLEVGEAARHRLAPRINDLGIG